MEALAWLAIPVVSTLVAILWLAVIHRPRPPADPRDTVQAHERFRDALKHADTPEHSRGDSPGSDGPTRT